MGFREDIERDYAELAVLAKAIAKPENKEKVVKITDRGWTRVPNSLIEREDLDSTEKLILIHFLRFYPKIFPSQPYLAKRCGVSVSTIKRALEHLKNKGLIKTDKEGSKGKANEYSLAINLL